MTSPTVRRRRLSTELRKQRVRAGLTVNAVAGELEWSPAKLGHIESGIRKWPSIMEVSELLRLYGVTGVKREAILTLARESRLRPWWTEYADVLPLAYVGNEAGAVAIRTYAGIVVPDLLQVPEYTECLARAQGRHGAAVDRVVAGYLKRQEVLEHPTGLRYHAILEEEALQRVAWDSDLLHTQLRHLVTVAERNPGVTIQLIPTAAGPHAGAAGPFSLLEFDGDESALAYLDAAAGGRIEESPGAVARCEAVWERLAELATPAKPTITALRRRALFA
ncbi:helix-turn-helix domain-containing protein [Spiractinospora alimapuensis]|uniref:helix-turn-helix domain-containing protein n=1 Tax=Spiractinospora alimapuensis TaxID=2820884 RepID=UPI001F3B6B71|nr:helix-turn-helix transcriptional regulator [Spiractinospora alimapuensis]QVQ50472.1 helix-turn-helix domain-containing protein [Spiractinospora alimapuensis]